MADLSLNCPYCNTINAGFTMVSVYGNPRNTMQGIVFMACNLCSEGVSVKIQGRQHAPSLLHNNPYLLNISHSFTIISVEPKVKEIDLPEYLPDNVANSFLQAKKSIRIQAWDSAGVMCRQALERALTYIKPDTKGQILFQRIEKIHKEGLIISALKDWAHNIRVLGNDAAHEDDFIEKEAKELVEFTELFLTYLFTMPEKVKKSREAIEADNKQQQPA